MSMEALACAPLVLRSYPAYTQERAGLQSPFGAATERVVGFGSIGLVAIQRNWLELTPSEASQFAAIRAIRGSPQKLQCSRAPSTETGPRARLKAGSVINW